MNWHQRLTENLKLMQQWDELNKPDYFRYEMDLAVARMVSWHQDILAGNKIPATHDDIGLTPDLPI